MIATLHRLWLQDQVQEVPAEHQARGERDDHQRDPVVLAGPIGATVEDNGNRQHEEAKGERYARLGQTHSILKRRAFCGLGSNPLTHVDRLLSGAAARYRC